MSFADSKEIAEYAVRVMRVLQSLPAPRQVEVMSVSVALVNAEFSRWQHRQQQMTEVRDE